MQLGSPTIAAASSVLLALRCCTHQRNMTARIRASNLQIQRAGSEYIFEDDDIINVPYEQLQLQMGYAQLEQTGRGIHLRQFSRAFVFEDTSGETPHRLVFVSVDAAMMGHGVRKEVRLCLIEVYHFLKLN